MTSYYDEIEIEDFDWDEETETYYYPCPCGRRFEITKVILAYYVVSATPSDGRVGSTTVAVVLLRPSLN